MEQNTNQAPVCKNQEMQQYFNTLPQFVQETLILSGPEMNTLQELKCCAENLMKNRADAPKPPGKARQSGIPGLFGFVFSGRCRKGGPSWAFLS